MIHETLRFLASTLDWHHVASAGHSGGWVTKSAGKMLPKASKDGSMLRAKELGSIDRAWTQLGGAFVYPKLETKERFRRLLA